MNSKLYLVMTLGYLAAEGKRGPSPDSDVVLKPVCLGMQFRSGPLSSFEIALKLLRTIKNFASTDEGEKHTPPLRENNPITSETSDDCNGIRVILPIPVDIYNNIKSVKRNIDKQAARIGAIQGEEENQVKQENLVDKVIIEWKDKEITTPKPYPKPVVESYATINGFSVDMDEVMTYIGDLLKNPRRMFTKNLQNEIENGAFKSELVDYPPDYLKKRLQVLIAIKEAREKN